MWISIVGLGYPNEDGSDRAENARLCREDDTLYLFWDKQNVHDKNAIAVFRKRGRHEEILSSDQIGFLPCDLAKDAVTSYTSGQRVGAVVTSIYRGVKGYTDIKVRLETYVTKEVIKRRESELRKVENDFIESPDYNLYDFLLRIARIDYKKVITIKESPLWGYEALCNATIKELTKLPGIGNVTAKRIKDELARIEKIKNGSE